MSFKVGDYVSYSIYGPRRAGIVVDISEDYADVVYVKWSNGRAGPYLESELILITEEDVLYRMLNCD